MVWAWFHYMKPKQAVEINSYLKVAFIPSGKNRLKLNFLLLLVKYFLSFAEFLRYFRSLDGLLL